jgi:predicted pyridoxine 5'-phosphate oxidase superfamily flavin-nucleotide-binding protein
LVIRLSDRQQRESQMARWIQELISKSHFCVLATTDAKGNCDASPEVSTAGFLKVLNDKRLFIPGAEIAQKLAAARARFSSFAKPTDSS